MKTPRDINLWRIPLQVSLTTVLLFFITLTPDVLAAQGLIQLPKWFSMGSIDDSRAILGALLGAVSTVLALIFSVALLVLSMVATLFGPRLLYRFVQDWVTQFTIGAFMGTFVYILLVFLVLHSDAHSTFIPQTCLFTSWFLVIGSFSLLVYYSHRIAVSIQNPDMVARIGDDIRRTLEHRPPAEAAAPPAAEGGTVVLCRASGYIQEVHYETLVGLAQQHQGRVELYFRPGQFCLQGEPLARIWPSSLEAEVRRHVRLGRHRLLLQDSEFGILQMVEIAIRALSPAINDTFTGVACTDWLGDALVSLAEAGDGICHWADGQGVTRLSQPPLPFARLAKAGFDQIRQAAQDTPAVQIRLLRTIQHLLPRVAEKDREGLWQQAQAIAEMAENGQLASLDKAEVLAVYQHLRALEKALTGSPPALRTSCADKR